MWVEKSANQGNAEAQLFLGKLYYTGDGVVEDDWEALIWLEKSAELGEAEAQFLTGTMYYFGQGTYRRTKNIRKAVFWLDKAKKNGETRADEFMKKYDLTIYTLLNE